jgi:hypothetical protein
VGGGAGEGSGGGGGGVVCFLGVVKWGVRGVWG